MITWKMDPDVVRWRLHELCVCPVGNAGSHSMVTCYEADLSHGGYVEEGHCEEVVDSVENDEVIAHALQEEYSKLAAAEASGSSDVGEKQLQASVLEQNWLAPSKRHTDADHDNMQEDADKGEICCPPEPSETLSDAESSSQPPQMADDSALDGEVGKRLNQMVPIPHVPRINRDIPSEDDAESDHQRLLDRLKVYDLVELKVKGDGNCQFHALSDQIYRTVEHHKFVRQQVVDQLRSQPELYEAFVPMPYDVYLEKMSKNGEWGDHVTLQAASDKYGFKVFVLTSFKDTCYIEILPHVQKSNRVIFLSFWAEVHYNSIYPEGEFPVAEHKKKKWWTFGL